MGLISFMSTFYLCGFFFLFFFRLAFRHSSSVCMYMCVHLQFVITALTLEPTELWLLEVKVAIWLKWEKKSNQNHGITCMNLRITKYIWLSDTTSIFFSFEEQITNLKEELNMISKYYIMTLSILHIDPKLWCMVSVLWRNL